MHHCRHGAGQRHRECADRAGPRKALIRVAVYAQNGFVMLRFENYCAQPVELRPDGLPRQSSHAAMT